LNQIEIALYGSSSKPRYGVVDGQPRCESPRGVGSGRSIARR